MKSINLLTFLILCLGLAFTSCQSSESKKIRDEAREALPAPSATDAAVTPATPPATPPATNPNEPHYKCPNNCQGGVGATAGPCPVCGTELAHNQAYHNPPPNQANPATTTTPPTITPPANTNTTQPPAPAQNAAGVYHYTCSNGCAGGGASATACATCGATLVHNQAYHNN